MLLWQSILSSYVRRRILPCDSILRTFLCFQHRPEKRFRLTKKWKIRSCASARPMSSRVVQQDIQASDAGPTGRKNNHLLHNRRTVTHFESYAKRRHSSAIIVLTKVTKHHTQKKQGLRSNTRTSGDRLERTRGDTGTEVLFNFANKECTIQHRYWMSKSIKPRFNEMIFRIFTT